MNDDGKSHTEIYDRLLKFWAVEESILHSYPGIFLASQAILFASAVIIFFQPERFAWYTQALFFAVSTVGLTSALLWALLFGDRAIAANYFTTALKRLEKGEVIEEGILTSFSDYRLQNNIWLGLLRFIFGISPPKAFRQIWKRSWTRCILGLFFPCAVGALWLFIISVDTYLLVRSSVAF